MRETTGETTGALVGRESRFVSMDDLVPIFREQLGEGRTVKFMPRGVSMLPMLRQGADSVVLAPAPSRLSRYDIPLYQRDNGSYVLHRVIRVAPDGTYVCMGDNQFQPEPGIRHDQVIGVVESFFRGERQHSVDEPRYKLYCVLWCATRSPRKFARRCAGFARRCVNFAKRCLRFARRKLGS